MISECIKNRSLLFEGRRSPSIRFQLKLTYAAHVTSMQLQPTSAYVLAISRPAWFIFSLRVCGERRRRVWWSYQLVPSVFLLWLVLLLSLLAALG